MVDHRLPSTVHDPHRGLPNAKPPSPVDPLEQHLRRFKIEGEGYVHGDRSQSRQSSRSTRASYE